MPIAIVIWRNPPPRHATPKGVRLVSWSSTDQAGAATAAARQSIALIVDAGRDVDGTPAAAAAVTFSSLNEEEEPSVRSSVPTSSPRPHSKTANFSANLWRIGVRFLRRV